MYNWTFEYFHLATKIIIYKIQRTIETSHINIYGVGGYYIYFFTIPLFYLYLYIIEHLWYFQIWNQNVYLVMMLCKNRYKQGSCFYKNPRTIISIFFWIITVIFTVLFRKYISALTIMGPDKIHNLRYTKFHSKLISLLRFCTQDILHLKVITFKRHLKVFSFIINCI